MRSGKELRQPGCWPWSCRGELLLVVGAEHLEVEPEDAGDFLGRENGKRAEAADEPSSADTELAAGKEGPKVRAGTKQALLIEMLRRPEGATIEQVIAATSWQAHTVRGAMAGALKKKLGLEINSTKEEGHGRVYRIVDPA